MEITTAQIFEANQVLTLAIAKTLIGKKIAVTNSEYKYNTPDVRIGTVMGIESKWDWAGKEDHSHLDSGKWATRQDYWASYMGEMQIEEMKNTLQLVGDTAMYCTCELKSRMYAEPTFFGSDADREIYYIVIE